MPRKHERLTFLVQIELHSASGKYEARISDISEGGCYVDTIVSVNIGDEIKFDLVHPNGGRIAFTGEATFHDPGVGFGVRFTNLSDEQNVFLKRVLKKWETV